MPLFFKHFYYRLMKPFFILLIFLGLGQYASAQSTSDILLGGGLDLIKTDNPGLFEKVQVGVEMNYFVARHFAICPVCGDDLVIRVYDDKSFAYAFEDVLYECL